MRIADFLLGHSLHHVIPILDAGFDAAAGTNVIVMPIATKSLQQLLDERTKVEERESLEILIDIAAGLEEIGDIIHRDLKPGNVLLHDIIWKLADLGLARFAEATTSLHTMREALTSAYAAPEQWRGERPSKATDVFALGCIMYALLRGEPPYNGPETPDFSHQHQFLAPPSLDASPHYKRIAIGCLAKMPELRPPIESLRQQLQTTQAIARGGRRRLAAIAAAVIEERALEEERRLQEEHEQERRKQIAAEGVSNLAVIFKELEDDIIADAPNVRVERESENGSRPRGSTSIKLNRGIIEYSINFPYTGDGKVDGSWSNGVPVTGELVGLPEWHVLAGAYIAVTSGWSGSTGISANLWLARMPQHDSYRWWEVSYADPEANTKDERSTTFSVMGSLSDFEPFGLRTIYRYTRHVLARDPIPVTPELIEEFIDRWIDAFTTFSEGDEKGKKMICPRPFQPQPISLEFLVKSSVPIEQRVSYYQVKL
jgi:serine/threonine protein kinase